VDRKMAAFNKSSAGLIRVERFAYTSIRGKHRFYPAYRFFKRGFDLVCSFCAVVVLSPLLLLCALCVKILGGPGPIIFAQERVGLDGRLFKMFKFRSMRKDAEALKEKLLAQNEATGPVFKMENDPRIYPFGRILRKYSIDELPQLFNILKNDMSIVGPRPPVPKEVATYEPWQRMRLSVKPGLVCHWQVRKHDSIDFKEWVRSDNQYVHHGDLKTDFELIAKTFRIVFGGGNK
jgi:lipopolysaccharide/colanic/teichoic acid biosynthesis glycosyltransferase